MIIFIVWGILSIISANILLRVWDKEDGDDDELTLLSYLGAYFFGTLMAPVITTLALLGWLGTITPKKANEWIKGTYNSVKEATIGHWRGTFGARSSRWWAQSYRW
jgi:multisubunit Na+/H+ antiporter MnhF subunit